MNQNSKLAFVFPGQGSQALEMLSDCLNHSITQSYFERADRALGYSLSEYIKNGPIEKLNDTTITQPALLTVSIILWELYRASNGVMPRYLAGHSLGEYSALVAAGVIEFEDAVRLVSKRGKYMQEAVPAGVGAMAAIIGMDDADVVAVCDAVTADGESANIQSSDNQSGRGQLVTAVNFNSPGQVVIAGNKAAVDQACELAKERGARRALPLPVSVPSHCMLMKPAADCLEVLLNDIPFNAPLIETFHNVDVASHSDGESIKSILVQQLYQPVRWTETIEKLASEGIEEIVECGAGRVLAGLIRRINRDIATYNISDQASLENVISEIS